MKSQVYKALAVQYFIGCFFLVSLSFWESDYFFSGFAGFLTAFVPSVYISSRMARNTGCYSAQQCLSYAYKAQLGKWFITVVMFTLILFIEYNWSFAVLFTGFCLMQITGCIVPLMIKDD